MGNNKIIIFFGHQSPARSCGAFVSGCYFTDLSFQVYLPNFPSHPAMTV
jgi:hypothetical protein